MSAHRPEGPSPHPTAAGVGRVVVAISALWILALHPTLQALDAPVYVLGPLDWSAHLATVLLLVANLPRAQDRRLVIAALVASVALDVDHLPAFFGTDVLTAGAPRPYPHSLATVALLALAAAATRDGWRSVLLGAAAGVLAHLMRDLATGDGVALVWPLTSEAFRAPFWVEAALVAALAARAWTCAGGPLPHGRLPDRARRSRLRPG